MIFISPKIRLVFLLQVNTDLFTFSLTDSKNYINYITKIIDGKATNALLYSCWGTEVTSRSQAMGKTLPRTRFVMSFYEDDMLSLFHNFLKRVKGAGSRDKHGGHIYGVPPIDSTLSSS
jgi:hypothetical protein